MKRAFARQAAISVLLAMFPIFAALPVRAFEVAPVLLDLPRERPVTTLTLRNPKPVPVSLELTAFSWTQDGEDEQYAEEARLIVTPPLVHLLPGESRVARIGLMETESFGPAEAAFRLLVRDITAEPDRSAGLRLRVQMLLPVFLGAAQPKQAFSLEAWRRDEDTLCLAGANAGHGHEKLVFLEPGEGGVRTGALKYFLPRMRATFCAQTPFSVQPGMRVRAAFVSAEAPDIRWQTLVVRNALPSPPQN